MIDKNELSDQSIEAAARAYERISGPMLIRAVRRPSSETIAVQQQQFMYVRKIIVPCIFSQKDSKDPIELCSQAYEKHLGPVRGFSEMLEAKEARRKKYLREILIPAMFFAAKHPTSERCF